MCDTKDDVSSPGVVPDFESSPDVLIWMWMFRGVDAGGESASRPRWSCVAFLAVSIEETRYRFGI